jgi:pimeloyl-ACP methyl ester carboxylesterase
VLSLKQSKKQPNYKVVQYIRKKVGWLRLWNDSPGLYSTWRRLMDILLETIKFVVILAVALVAFVYFFQSRLIFFPQRTPVGLEQSLKAHEVKVTNQGRDLYGWFVNDTASKTSPVIVYYGGNAEEVSGSLQEARGKMDASLLFMNYRGYGKSRGRPSEQRLLSDALAVFDQIIVGRGIDPTRVILMGRSLGTGVAVHVAAHRQVGALLLVTPFDSLVNVAKGIYPFLPVGKLLRHRFDSVAVAPGIKTPMLAVIADRDEIIPTANSLNLVNAWGGPAETLVIKGATHNDISAFPSYWKEIERFINDRNIETR